MSKIGFPRVHFRFPKSSCPSQPRTYFKGQWTFDIFFVNQNFFAEMYWKFCNDNDNKNMCNVITKMLWIKKHHYTLKLFTFLAIYPCAYHRRVTFMACIRSISKSFIIIVTLPTQTSYRESHKNFVCQKYILFESLLTIEHFLYSKNLNRTKIVFKEAYMNEKVSLSFWNMLIYARKH